MEEDMTGITTSNPTLPEVIGGVVAVVVAIVAVVVVVVEEEEAMVVLLLVLSGDIVDLLLYDLSWGLGGAGLGWL